MKNESGRMNVKFGFTLLVLGVPVALWAAGGPMMGGSMGGGPMMMQPRVPADKLEEARALTSPLPDSEEAIERGKALYNGKGTCFNCHGKGGGGDGPVAAGLDPAPRNFHHHGFWRHRTEGEIFWVIKHGSSGTAMVPFGGLLSDEEIWAVIQYERSFAGEHGSHGGRGPMGRGGMGPGDGMGGCEGQGCDR
jgi:mono/diheme cytochrome c family protein